MLLRKALTAAVGAAAVLVIALFLAWVAYEPWPAGLQVVAG